MGSMLISSQVMANNSAAYYFPSKSDFISKFPQHNMSDLLLVCCGLLDPMFSDSFVALSSRSDVSNVLDFSADAVFFHDGLSGRFIRPHQV